MLFLMPRLNSQMHSAYSVIAPIATPNNFLSKSLLMLSLFFVVDPVRDTLQAQVDQLSGWVNWATATVGFGVALEAIEPIHDLIAWIKFRKKDSAHIKELAEFFPVSRNKSKYTGPPHPSWLKWFGRVGVIVVVAGVVAEWRCGAKLEDAQNAVHKYDVAKLTEADQKAGNAAKSAKTADDKAQAADASAGKAQSKANAVGKQAADLLAKYTAAESELEEEKRKRLAVAASLLPRRFRDQSGALNVLKNLPTVNVVFEFLDEGEIEHTAKQINWVIADLNWKSSRRHCHEFFIREGVTVSPGSAPPPSRVGEPAAQQAKEFTEFWDKQATAKRISESLVVVLNHSDIDAKLGILGYDLPADTILISIGPKPNRASEETIKELARPSPTPREMGANVVGGILESGNEADIPDAQAKPCKE